MTTDVLIQVQDLKKHFTGTSAIKALDGVSVDIKKGEVVVVIGPSGSGKSTFLRCLNLLEVPTGGQILFNGVDITDKSCNINLHRQKMGMVFQHFNLFPHMTILRNMTLAPVKLLHKSQEEADAQALKLLQRVGRQFFVIPANGQFGAQRGFVNLLIGWGRRNAAQYNAFHRKCVTGAKERSDVVEAADIVQYNDYRILFCGGKSFGREASQGAVGDFLHLFQRLR